MLSLPSSSFDRALAGTNEVLDGQDAAQLVRASGCPADVVDELTPQLIEGHDGQARAVLRSGEGRLVLQRRERWGATWCDACYLVEATGLRPLYRDI